MFTGQRSNAVCKICDTNTCNPLPMVQLPFIMRPDVHSPHWEHDLSSPDIWKNGGSWKVTGLMWQFTGLPPLWCVGCTHSLISWQDRVAHWHDSVTSLRSKRRSGISFAPHRDPRRGWDEVRRSHSCLSSTAAEWREVLGEWHSQRPVLKSLKRTKQEEEQGGWD